MDTAIRFRRHFSLRTMLLVMLSVALLCGVLQGAPVSAELGHLLIVLAFALPGASAGYDLRPTSRTATVACSVAAVTGTLLLSTIVVAKDWIALWW